MTIQAVSSSSLYAIPSTFGARKLANVRFLGSTSSTDSVLDPLLDSDVLSQIEKIKKAQLPEADKAIKQIEGYVSTAKAYTALQIGILGAAVVFELVSAFLMTPLVPIIAAPFFVAPLVLLTLLRESKKADIREAYGNLTQKLGVAPDFKELPNPPKSLTTA